MRRAKILVCVTELIGREKQHMGKNLVFWGILGDSFILLNKTWDNREA
jgi:hypothetical protein